MGRTIPPDQQRGYRDEPADQAGPGTRGASGRRGPLPTPPHPESTASRSGPGSLPPGPESPAPSPGAQRPPGAGAHTPSRSETSALPPYSGSFESYRDEADPQLLARPGGLRRTPRKLTVTRVAALRSAQLTQRGIEKFHGAVSRDGADRSGLGHLTYAVMANYAVDAALAVALANTLFFAAAKADSTGKVLLYLLLTVAPFAVIAPLIGPLLDRLQNGRRIALAASSFGRTILAVVMAVKFDSWVIYPCALGMLVLSKSFGVLKAALTPRVLPEASTLVKTNSRLSVFGLIAGGVSGAVAAGIAALTGSAGALGFTAACGLVGGWLCLRIPAWVESTEGEVPVRHVEGKARARVHRVLPRPVTTAIWTNATIRVQTGFLALFIAFVIKSRYQSSSVIAGSGASTIAPTDREGWMQLLLLGTMGAVAGLGGFLGNALGARLPLRTPQNVALVCVSAVIAAVLLAFLVPGLITAGVVALVGSTSSSLAKVCLDATIQLHLPEASRASAFGRSESMLQLSWVFGGVIGLLIGGVWALGGNSVYLVGFGILGLLLLAGAAQCVALRLGHNLLSPIGAWWRLHRGSRHETTPLQRPRAGMTEGPGTIAAQRGGLARRAEAAPRAPSPNQRRAPRKAGRPR